MIKALKVLFLDDDDSNIKPVTDFFQLFSGEVFFTLSIDEALDNIQTHTPHLTLISLKLAHANNWYFLKEIKEHLMPIIGLVETEQCHLMKKGQHYGINAYLVKPFDLLHLKVHFRSTLAQIGVCKKNMSSAKERRSNYDRRALQGGRRWYDRFNHLEDDESEKEMDNVENEKIECIQIGPFTVNYQEKRVYRNENNLKLTPKEYKLFLLLIQNKDQVVSANDILSHIWTSQERASKEDVKQYIYMLRKKIEKNPSNPSLIVNHKGFGYFLHCPEEDAIN
ncbi:winged helix-turn-helix domain-containing protein [Nitrosomonas communis]|uniref:DNA-binding response regulator, OmpR family, contains REC and winged-helix (WHTH) domain n=1 Tax=Nitrosomonas communis TaxID=44574 RepID=A0A1H2S9U6_9PROT|nr:response regulator transcription factor [Nitrosomonas communis]SDW27914.1 DNA-binding response regulator, OmpR family, contains REC and winged-helix (wHTH) domain [Nitrosomonas communis]